ncbi:MAG: hypothetical protein HUJ25_04070 [Crocinitomicaceae bacterium]|nr:hypothetical protein [Crocinitomicaceae bacterium]
MSRLKFIVGMLAASVLWGCNSGTADPESREESTEQSDTLGSDGEETGNNKYLDTAIFNRFDGNYDYWYAYMTIDGEEQEFVVDEDISNQLSGSTLKIEWKIDTAYEAGEGDEPYEVKRLVNYEVLEKAEAFEDFLKRVAKVFTDTSVNDLSQFASKNTPYRTAFNPGVACHLGDPMLDYEHYISTDYIISDEMPQGDFCEGYEGVKNGFYYSHEYPVKIPVYATFDDNGDFVEYKPELPGDLTENSLRMALVIHNEWHYAYLYFIMIEGKWYLWIEDLCDCSA